MLNAEQKLTFLTNINTKLLETHAITTYEYEIFKQIKIEQNNIGNISIDTFQNNYKKVGEENNLNKEIMGNKIIQEKIKTNIEKILSYISNKKEYEFISDFFISEFDPLINTKFLKKNSSINTINHSESNLSENINNNNLKDFDNINEDILNMLSKANLIDINSINKFNEEINKNYKSRNSEISNESSSTYKKNSGLTEEEFLFPEITKVKSHNSINSNNIGSTSKEDMDKELEEEINRQIFGYTKKMKESARNFGVQLKKDNQTLNKIENLQDKVNEKTTKQVKRLEEFNYSIKIGFCKLMILLFTVIGSFIGTMFIIKIFPKFA